MNVNGTLKLKWKEKDQYYQRDIKRNYLYDSFFELMNNSNNEYDASQRLLKDLPNITQLSLDWDSRRDINYIHYIIENESVSYGISVIYSQKNILAILKKCCQDGISISAEEFMNKRA